MCIGFWSLTHPDYSLVLCNNRDEYLSRPTDPAYWHSFDSSRHIGLPSDEGHNGFVLSGIDTLAGGTWFGVNRHGDVALLTNITEPDITAPVSSRGHLCSSFLLRNNSPSQTSTLRQFLEQITASDTHYAGFNMLLLAAERTHDSVVDGQYAVEYESAMLSNGQAGKPILSIPVVKKTGGISNGSLTGVDPFTGSKFDTEWPKVVLGQELFLNILSLCERETEDFLVEKLFGLLRKKTHSPPQTRQAFQETIMVDAVDLPNLRRGPSFAQTNPTSEGNHGQGETSHDAAIQSHMHSPTHRTSTRDSVPTPTAPKYYATRLSSLLLIRRDRSAIYVERDVWILNEDDEPMLVKQEGQATHERRYNFRIS